MAGEQDALPSGPNLHTRTNPIMTLASFQEERSTSDYIASVSFFVVCLGPGCKCSCIILLFVDLHSDDVKRIAT